MRKFKLIKEYPNSPELDTIVYENGQLVSTGGYYSHLPIGYPEFWEVINEKDYKILSFKHKDGSLYTKKHLTFVDFVDKTEGRKPEYWNDNMDAVILYSVKRLSDGEIFTIGDEVCDRLSQSSFGKINRLWISHEQLRCDIGNLGLVLCNSDKRMDIIKYIPKKPLFTTEDGVEVFIGDTYFSMYIKDYGYKKHRAESYHVKADGKYILDFSTKQAAEQYILMNKPCLSMKDILDNYEKDGMLAFMKFTDKLQELVKSKLNL